MPGQVPPQDHQGLGNRDVAGTHATLEAPTGADQVVKLADAAGANALSITDSDDTEVTRMSSDGVLTTNGMVDIIDGSMTIKVGADNLGNTRTNANGKNARIACAHYTNAEQPAGVFLATTANTDSLLDLGGGSSLVNAMTKIRFFLAANTTTTVGTETLSVTTAGMDFKGNAASNGLSTLSGSYAGIYVQNGSTAQSVPTGSTYTKLTGFTTDMVANDCTADAASDKITITRTGHYKVSGTISFSLSNTFGTSTYWSAFLDGSEIASAQSVFRPATNNMPYTTGFSGFVDVTSAPLDLDMRMYHSNGAAVDVTLISTQLTVERLGDT